MEGENTVNYVIYCDKSISDVERFCEECQLFCDALTKDYIWQKENFLLHPVEHQSGLPCLCGTTFFGENVSDEWFIVFLLFELTKQFNDIIVHVSDDDGEFLLIQAAEELPSWLKPETSENRVFLHKGNIHVIPQPSNPGEITIFPASTPSIIEAYDIVVGCNNTIAEQKIQTSIHKRISDFPERIQQNFHHAHCYIPAEIAYILQNKPHLIANAVQAFYLRDPIDVNICYNLQKFQPINCVLSRVKFTRYLYGQLYQAKFLPSAKSKWKLPNPQDKLYNAAYLGYKLTCGFEILLSRCTNADNENDLEPSGRLWEQYLSNLKKNDFFQGELEGSKKYLELLGQAKQHFKKTFCSSSSRTDGISEMISLLIAEANEHSDDWAYQDLIEEDSDDWLTLTTDEVDQLMLGVWGGDNIDGDNRDNVCNLSKMVTKVKSFVDNISSFEGAEVSLDDKNAHGNDEEIKFDPKTFLNCLEELINPPNYQRNFDTYESEDDENYDSASDIEDEFVSCFKDGPRDSELSHIMEKMDMELKESTIKESFQKENIKKLNKNNDAPLDIDYNVIENFLESFSSQSGLPGPVSSMLHSMGMNLPPDDGSS